MKPGQTLVIDRVVGGYVLRASSPIEALDGAPTVVCPTDMQAWVLVGQCFDVEVERRLARQPDSFDTSATEPE